MLKTKQVVLAVHYFKTILEMCRWNCNQTKIIETSIRYRRLIDIWPDSNWYWNPAKSFSTIMLNEISILILTLKRTFFYDLIHNCLIVKKYMPTFKKNTCQYFKILEAGKKDSRANLQRKRFSRSLIIVDEVDMWYWCSSLFLQDNYCLTLLFMWLQRDSNPQLLRRKRTLKYFAKLARWLSCVVSTNLYGALTRNII